MRALVYDGQPGAYRLAVDYEEPTPGPGEVRIRTVLAGICGTDLEIGQGYADFQGVLGHEFVGVVDRSEDPGLVGQRVVGEVNTFCGACDTCRKGLVTHCEHRTSVGIRGRDGVFADFFCLPARNLHLVPEGMPDTVAVFTEPLAAACEILEQVHIGSRDRVIVLGDGKLGQLTAQVLALTGCDLTVIGRHDHKLALLAERGIATQTGDQGFAGKADLVVECTGQTGGFRTARELVRPRGTLVLKSTYHGPVQVDLSSLVVDEIQVVGSRCGPFSTALRLLAQGQVEVTYLIEAEYPLDEAEAALEHAQRKGTLKVLVRP